MGPGIIIYFLVSLALIEASEVSPKNTTKRQTASTSLDPKEIDAAFTRGDNDIVVDIEDEEKSQYYETNYDNNGYGFGYDVGPSGQFHHEHRGPDDVTYGCYGYIDPDGMLRVTHYVADSHGYRILEPFKPVEIYPQTKKQGEEYDASSTNQTLNQKGIFVPWDKVFFPKGCGRTPGGIPMPTKPKPTRPPPDNSFATSNQNPGYVPPEGR